MSDKKTTIGYWYSKYEPQYPKPVEGKPFTGQKEFLERLEKIEKRTQKIHYKGWSRCRICNCMNGTTEHVSKSFRWPEGYIHYIRDHNVKPDEDFYNAVMKQTKSKVC